MQEVRTEGGLMSEVPDKSGKGDCCTFEIFQSDTGATIHSYECDYFTDAGDYKFWKRAARWFQSDRLVGTFPGHYRNVGVREKKEEK
jgi:hypothetical protein